MAERTAPTRVIIDTDPGIDDTAAIFFALASPDEIRIECFTTVFGNCSVEQATRNCLAILDVAGRADSPVYRGAGQPLLRDPRYAPHIHGDDGLGGHAEAYPPRRAETGGGAVEQLVERVMAEPGQITLVALGPLTNVALALRLEPRLAGALHELVLMGGAVRVPGNVTPVASANLANDPEAAAVVYGSGAPIVQVGLDVCRPCVVTHAHLDRIRAADTPATRLLRTVGDSIQANYRREYADHDGARFNDLPCMAYVVDPSLFRGERVRVEIETTGTFSYGQTIADWRGQYGREPNATVLLDVDHARLVDLFTERVVRVGS